MFEWPRDATSAAAAAAAGHAEQINDHTPMKMLLILLILAASVSFRPASYLPVTYDANGFFHLDSGQGPYVGYRPDGYSSATPINLFVWMHGCGGNAEGDLWAIAPPSTRATQTYIALSIGGRDGDCWHVDTDSPKVLAAITDIARYFNINARHVYLGGYSSGGDMTYRVGFQHAALFAGLLVENSDPFRDTGATSTALMAAAAWKINVAHLAHQSDAVYPIATVRTDLTTLATNGFPVSALEKAGTHYDPDSGQFGTTYDLIHSLLPFLDAGWASPIGISGETPTVTTAPTAHPTSEPTGTPVIGSHGNHSFLPLVVLN